MVVQVDIQFMVFHYGLFASVVRRANAVVFFCRIRPEFALMRLLVSAFFFVHSDKSCR